MASNKLFPAKTAKDQSCIIVNPEIMSDINAVNHDHNLFEFDEADIWHSNYINNSTTPEANKVAVPACFRNSSKKGGRKVVERETPPPVTCAASVPVNIPDWSKIYRGSRGDDQESDDDHDDEDSRVPPHEYLARRRGASFSVHEGIGRTLKGRDLRQVRNAIWKKVGFED